MAVTYAESYVDPVKTHSDQQLENELNNVKGNVSPNVIKFPISRSKLAEHYGVSAMTIGRWVKTIEEVRVITDEENQITEDGYTLVCQYSEATDKQAFLDSLIEEECSLALAPLETSSELISPLRIQTKASDRVTRLQQELQNLESDSHHELDDFLAITTEIIEEDEASSMQDEMEWRLLRQQHANKWLKRRAQLEQDKQRILQSELPLPKKEVS